ncbi:MAG: sulfite exporter TauE/SafE family protein [Alphaproteobacteria bacterium]|nr:MAG: sulfite exporter TauE/SafE family protein [Alphaproteobacteria bacterium]
MGELNIAELWPLVLALLAAGIVGGILAGLLGVGGGIVIVPVLFHIFTGLGIDESVRMHLAVGTSLATIIPTSIRSMTAHAKRGAVDFELLKAWALPIFVGVLLGGAVAAYSPGEILTLVFAVIALVVAFHMSFGNEDWRLKDTLPAKWIQNLMAATIGLLSTLMGIGGGTFGVTTMTLFGYPIHRAVATASGFGVIISIPGAITFIVSGWGKEVLPSLSVGHVNLIGFALITPMTVLAAPLGVKIAHALPRLWLRRAFAFFLGLTSLRMFLSLLG